MLIKRVICASYMISAVLCAFFLCAFVGNNTNYTYAEDTGGSGTISAFVENGGIYGVKGEIAFDDSIWGRFAKALQSGFEAWFG